MPNITNVLNDQIRRLARREIRASIRTTRKQTAQYRRDIVALKRSIAGLTRTMKHFEKLEKRRGRVPVGGNVAEPKENLRFRADGLKTHRQKLGISALDYGRLVGVSGLTIYNWESKKSKPRSAQLAKLATVRGLGKREASKRLEMMSGPERST